MRHSNNDPFKDFNNDFNKGAKRAARGFGLVAIIALILNFVLTLGLFAGICWIVKYFFFSS